MLRRPPTTIKLTAEDVLAYDDEKEREKVRAQKACGAAESKGGMSSTKPSGDPRSRNERIGISRPRH